MSMPDFASIERSARNRLGGMGMGQDGDDRVPLEQANYRAPSEDPARACGGCAHFIGPDECEVVAGVIDPAGTSDLFEPAGAAPAAPAPMAPPAPAPAGP